MLSKTRKVMPHRKVKPKIVISTNTAWNIYNFRAGLVRALVSQGYEVVALAPDDSYAPRLRELGCTHVSLPMDNNGTNPLRDLALTLRYFNALRRLRPVAYLGYTVKPNVYGSIAAQALGIAVINNIAGLGATFIKTNHVTKIVRGLYRVALARSHRVFFQNSEDQALFVESRLARPEVCGLVPGSGIDLTRYVPEAPEPFVQRGFRFLLVARMLRDKGVEEFAAAAKIIRGHFPEVRFQLLGSVNSNNSNGIALEKIRGWESEGLVEYLGTTDDVRSFLASADCVVLPSYREGVPRSLLEAAAMARPIVATDVVGCRDAVQDGVNGFLCKVRDAADLASKMMRMIELPEQQRLAMGAAGRQKVEKEFDEQLVIQKYLYALTSLMSPGHDNSSATEPDGKSVSEAGRPARR
jgi:glycosyltransferase involved in cell wall biosynthesis